MTLNFPPLNKYVIYHYEKNIIFFQSLGQVANQYLHCDDPDLIPVAGLWEFMCKSNSICIFVRAFQAGILCHRYMYQACWSTWIARVSTYLDYTLWQNNIFGFKNCIVLQKFFIDLARCRSSLKHREISKNTVTL